MTSSDDRRGTIFKDGLHSAFPTPLLVKRYDDAAELNERLMEHIAAREANEASMGLSNVGGWHSPPDLLDSHDPAILELRKRISACTHKMLVMTRHKAPTGDQTMRISAWANVARAGA